MITSHSQLPDDAALIRCLDHWSIPHSHWTAEAIADCLAAPGTLVITAAVDEQWCGFLVMRISGEFADVFYVYLAEEQRRRGIGDRLMAAAEDAARASSAARVLLEVRVGNAPALRLYEKRGYQLVARKPAYYSDGEDAYVMLREIL